MSDLLNRGKLAWGIILLFAALCAMGFSQTVLPFGGYGSVQFLDNNGKVLTAGFVYFYQAGTTTFIPVYADSTGTVLQPNPVPLGPGARATIWLTNGTFIKAVLCLQNDGAACAPADVLFSVDQVPIGATSGGGGGGGSGTFTGTFISGSVSPSTTGIVRLSTGDSVCWRNAAGTSNLCIAKDTNDVLSWAGGIFKLPEGVCSPTSAGFDYLCADTATHRFKESGNAGGYAVFAIQGVDINSSDQVNQLHFGATPTPLSGTAPTTGQFLQWNGSQIIGNSYTAASADLTAQGANIAGTTIFTPTTSGYYEFFCYVVLTRAATTSSTLPGCNLSWTDADSSTAQSTGVTSTSNLNVVGTIQGLTGVPAAIWPLLLEAKAGTNVQYSTTGYASSGATAMNYAIHVRVVGPF